MFLRCPDWPIPFQFCTILVVLFLGRSYSNRVVYIARGDPLVEQGVSGPTLISREGCFGSQIRTAVTWATPYVGRTIPPGHSGTSFSGSHSATSAGPFILHTPFTGGTPILGRAVVLVGGVFHSPMLPPWVILTLAGDLPPGFSVCCVFPLAGCTTK